MLNKKYQVFVSSTYQDLEEERKEVIQALLELDCIPIGMELFPAADDDQWTLIQRLIEDSDYYILIIGARYGSTTPEGISYTQMEYEYAIKMGVPVISFLHKNPENIIVGKTDQDELKKNKLNDFKSLVQKKMCKYWDSPSDLGSVVSRSLVHLIKTKPRTGWIKADKASAEEANEEILNLRKKVDDLQSQISNLSTTIPAGTENLQQGDDKFKIDFRCVLSEEWGINDTIYQEELGVTWNEIFKVIAPLMIDEAKELSIRTALEEYLSIILRKSPKFIDALKDKKLKRYGMRNEDFKTIVVQIRALGLISKSEKKRSMKEVGITFWKLTPYGDNLMTQLIAIKK